jgi:hypothetical protein
VISKTKSYTAREDARKALRIKYPAFADMVVTPSGERMDHKPGVF